LAQAAFPPSFPTLLRVRSCSAPTMAASAERRRAGWKGWAAAQAQGVEEAGGWRRPAVRRDGAAGGRSRGELATEVERLRAEKARAVEEEEYEEAAVLKRRIQALEAALEELPPAAEEPPPTASPQSPMAGSSTPSSEPRTYGGPPPGATAPAAASSARPKAAESSGPAAAELGASVQPAGPDGNWEVVHERLAVRTSPSTRGSALTVVKQGRVLFGTPYDIDGNPWLRLDLGVCEDLEIRDDSAWVLIHGRCVGLGELLRRKSAKLEEPAEKDAVESTAGDTGQVVAREEAGASADAASPPFLGFGRNSYSAYRARSHSDSEGSAGLQGESSMAGAEEEEWDAVNQCWKGESKENELKSKPEETWDEGEAEGEWDEEWDEQAEGDEEWWEEEEEEAGEEEAEEEEEAESRERAAFPDGGVGRRESVGGSRPISGPGPPHDSAGDAGAAVAATGSTGVTARLPEVELERFAADIEAARKAGNKARALRLLKSRSELYRSHGEFGLALTDAEVCVELAPEDPESLFLRAVARLEAGGHDQPALADLRAAQRLGLTDSEEPSLQKWIRRAKHWMGQVARVNHYLALGAQADATAEQVRQAHRRAALRWHPDKPGGDAERFRAAQAAWEVLGNADRRRAYDFGNSEPAARRAAPGAARPAPGGYMPSAGFFVPPPRQGGGRMPPGGFYIPPSKYKGGGASPGFVQGSRLPKTVNFSAKNGSGPRMNYSTGPGGFARGFGADRA